MHQQQTAFENIVGKGEIACNEQFLLFLLGFLLNQIIVSPFVHIFDIISLFAAELEKPKIGISCKGLSLLTCADNIPCPIRKNIWKTFLEKEKMLVVNILSFLCYVFYHMKVKLNILSDI